MHSTKINVTLVKFISGQLLSTVFVFFGLLFSTIIYVRDFFYESVRFYDEKC